jgi:hypothetical protein
MLPPWVHFSNHKLIITLCSPLVRIRSIQICYQLLQTRPTEEKRCVVVARGRGFVSSYLALRVSSFSLSFVSLSASSPFVVCHFSYYCPGCYCAWGIGRGGAGVCSPPHPCCPLSLRIMNFDKNLNDSCVVDLVKYNAKCAWMFIRLDAWWLHHAAAADSGPWDRCICHRP